ncbi:hypothetical protein GCM10011586_02570 [Silvibacterium dinghuense]|nr:hypothetical protein GCM10011586_02570 [Silvibacterium dinghuense]
MHRVVEGLPKVFGIIVQVLHNVLQIPVIKPLLGKESRMREQPRQRYHCTGKETERTAQKHQYSSPDDGIADPEQREK